MNKEAILRAADWLEANPDKHIRGKMAATGSGRPCSPIDHRAECFCAMGRIIRETWPAGHDHLVFEGKTDLLIDLTYIPDQVCNRIISLNDKTYLGLGDRGNPQVIEALRSIAA